MRPLKLTVKGFTAFRDEQTLDFTDLDVFAISGPTGSGKSSLLDALTFALYGRVERVGNSVGQLISQGQPAMAVTLEFEVGREVHRVSRRTPAKGSTKILLERRLPDGSWEQAGEGADRVRDVDRMIEGAVGLTYDGFTRSVLLPQGRFQEFMVGDPGKRREILTQLLGLSLFRRMAERAGSMAKESSLRAETTAGVIDHDFAEVTPEHVADALAEAASAAERRSALAVAADRARVVAGRWEEIRRTAADLRSCADEARSAAEAVARAANDLAGLVTAHATADEGLREARNAGAAAAAAHETAWTALAADESAFGTHQDLMDARVAAERLVEASANLSRIEADMEAAAAAATALETRRAEAVEALSAAVADKALRDAELTGAREALERVRHADLVAAVASGLHAGDACPVCGRDLLESPVAPGEAELRRVEKAASVAERALDAAARAVSDAERASDAVTRELETNAAERARLGKDADAVRKARVSYEAVIAERFGTLLVGDPVTEVRTRLAERDRLVAAERDAHVASTEAERTASRAEHEVQRVANEVRLVEAAVAADHSGLFARAARLLGPDAVDAGAMPAPSPATAGEPDPTAIAARASFVPERLLALHSTLEAEIAARGDAESTLIDALKAVTEGLLEPEDSVDAFVRTIEAASTAAVADEATAGQRAENLAGRLAKKDELLAEVQRLERRASIFKQLATELRQDRLVAYLQEEALHLLAVAGSERLKGLSDGRYRLVCRGDEFLVVDTWNADEERSVRTLSGGETFLASLALALALAEQVRSLSTTDRARLDSLFLDEGFGTLDQDTLRTVVDAIGQLGRDGRLVGVITHVRELADEFSRVEVEKSPRGSTLRLVPA
jgi:exonuclease SbcC